jgi:hypothetical protein
MGVQKHYKNILQNNRVERFLHFYQKIDQKSKTIFFSTFFYHVFGRFSVRGVQKHHPKKRFFFDPGPFFASEPPTHPKTGYTGGGEMAAPCPLFIYWPYPHSVNTLYFIAIGSETTYHIS